MSDGGSASHADAATFRTWRPGCGPNLQQERTIRLPIKVVPSSPRDGIAGWLGDRLKVRVRAPAERGRANAAAERVVAVALRTPQESVRIVAGRNSRLKVLDVSGLSEADVRRRLTRDGSG